MLEDTFESMEDGEEMEEEAEEEIDRILFEITAGEVIFSPSMLLLTRIDVWIFWEFRFHCAAY